MAWVDAAYLTNAIGAQQVASLGLTTGSDRLTQAELDARATVLSVVEFAGYGGQFTETLSVATESAKVTSYFLKGLCAALIIQATLDLVPGIQLTGTGTDFISRNLSKLDAVYNKKLPIPGAQPTPQNALGGVKFTPRCLAPRRFNLRGTSF